VGPCSDWQVFLRQMTSNAQYLLADNGKQSVASVRLSVRPFVSALSFEPSDLSLDLSFFGVYVCAWVMTLACQGLKVKGKGQGQGLEVRCTVLCSDFSWLMT